MAEMLEDLVEGDRDGGNDKGTTDGPRHLMLVGGGEGRGGVIFTTTTTTTTSTTTTTTTSMEVMIPVDQCHSFTTTP